VLRGALVLFGAVNRSRSFLPQLAHSTIAPAGTSPDGATRPDVSHKAMNASTAAPASAGSLSV